MKKITALPFDDIETIPALIKDFIHRKVPGYQKCVYNENNVATAIEKKRSSFPMENRTVLSEALAGQYQNLKLSEAQSENLAALNQPNTFTITTGHQLNLFSGPAFFIYKILQTIKTAQQLSEQFPQQQFVPIFWMASEDHDYEEINHFQTENGFYEMQAQAGGPVGRIIIKDDTFINHFKEEFRDTVFGTELIEMLKRCYKKGNTLSEATRNLVQELFCDYGLLALDGDDASLKSFMKEVFADELLNNSLSKKTEKDVEFLSRHYGKVQVNPRFINLFYLSETRDRIEEKDGQYMVVDTDFAFSKEEILSELSEFPERFSPNAVLRPVYQESILPNIAYIGGNAEVMYWLELGGYFSYLNLPFPILIPRCSMLMVSEKTFQKAEKLDLQARDLVRNLAEITKEKLLRNDAILTLLEQQKEQLKLQFKELKEAAAGTDVTFGNLVEAEETRQLKSFGRMRKRLLRAEKIKQAEKLRRLEDLYQTVHPCGIWQERRYNFSVFYSELGREWLYNCYSALETDKPELIIFSI